MSKEELLRVFKTLCHFETIVFQNRTEIPEYLADELFAKVDLVAKHILGEEDENRN